MDLVDAQVAFNQDHALLLAGGDFAVLLPDAFVEGILLSLEAAFVLAILFGSALVAAAGAGQRGLQ